MIRVREVWADNLESEFELIRSVIGKFPIISPETEFPGVVIKPPPAMRTLLTLPSDHYMYLKANVDLLELIQLRLTFSDVAGNLPDLGSGECTYTWQFHFSDFDVESHFYAPDLLTRRGIDFQKNRVSGINSADFAELAVRSGLVRNDSVSWATFRSAYDFGFLAKVLTRRQLPDDLDGFLKVLKGLFGRHVYDVKHLLGCAEVAPEVPCRHIF